MVQAWWIHTLNSQFVVFALKSIRPNGYQGKLSANLRSLRAGGVRQEVVVPLKMLASVPATLRHPRPNPSRSIGLFLSTWSGW